ncbi:FKBP-type peptidyl-prolyl cis-trans isomerase [Vibrio sp. ZSDZ34]|jgi:FKBP-type peptidyl-prolyl cis-trans isomerase|uniref:Peptidyl-prolyl cis-trans isomerase n=1 Tax=Vibrio gelatinilyticus TaxID=2893468 RepID=A0A9X1WAK7_9VIBR|nr:FKBP-type peptidyl-prolyl cis-trans isomerase N-terminal domain-containing protein [Vibrio gelatinilyticus]MCJ2376536.1 FKBP-type peptidyl-prolyl cis-trans isomerase [Vibrio gelatinilyticus]
MEFETLEQKVSYIFGREIGSELAKKSFPKMNIKIIQEAIMDTFTQKEWPFDPSDAEALKKEMETKREADKADVAQQKLQFEQAFFERNAQREEVTVHSSGIQYETLSQADEQGVMPQGSEYLLRHKTWLLNGKLIDTSTHLPEPLSLTLSQMPLSWLVAVKQMTAGAVWRLYVPAHLAMGDDEAGAIPPETAIIFDLHLIGAK